MLSDNLNVFLCSDFADMRWETPDDNRTAFRLDGISDKISQRETLLNPLFPKIHPVVGYSIRNLEKRRVSLYNLCFMA